MIKIKKAHIKEFRGIRDLVIDLDQKTLAVSGPNGSGKSGVIDAIEFALTGNISRLNGPGTKEFTLSQHGPHVDLANKPAEARVELEVFFPSLNKTARIERQISKSKRFRVDTDDSNILAILEEVAQHPEITLARREILRFILIEPSKRSEQIQEILKIGELGEIRSKLNTAFRKLDVKKVAADKEYDNKRTIFIGHLGVSSPSKDEILSSVNANRELVGLEVLKEFSSSSVIDLGLTNNNADQPLNKEASLIDLRSLSETLSELGQNKSTGSISLLNQIEALENNQQLLISIKQRELVESGLLLVNGPNCPLCDHTWSNELHLQSHLKTKQERLEQEGRMKQKLIDEASSLSLAVEHLKSQLKLVYLIAKKENSESFMVSIEEWGKCLALFIKDLSELSSILTLKTRLRDGWASVPDGFVEQLAAFTKIISEKPDQTAIVKATGFLINAEQRFKDYKTARQEKEEAARAQEASKAVYDSWCDAMDRELDALYANVEDDFSRFYRFLNAGDEKGFAAKFETSEGSLDFKVDFYNRGFFPPGALHSEGHQDGMGVCLYLALMKRLLADKFSISLLDDVVMSVDADHRYQFCQLLKSEFPDTQFVIATHDKVWAKQMQSAGLVKSKNSLVFDSWSVETGPIVASSENIWSEVHANLDKGKVDVAAAMLRRHIEYESRLLADQLGASAVFKADNNYDLGGLFPNAISQLKSLLGKAAEAAQSWGNERDKDVALAHKQDLKLAQKHKGQEDWILNKAVHYNEWANFSANDFKPVVEAFHKVIDCAKCSQCGSLLHISPRNSSPETLRCSCNAVNYNLNRKPKQ